MCGITGIINLNRVPVDLAVLTAMNDTLKHRGPDDAGIRTFPSSSSGMCAGLAMRRLSIIDLNTGAQPMSNETGTVWIVFNGEIYNYIELRKELEAGGHRFSTNSDTEVIVHLYEEKGFDCLGALRGMFAFALWDGNKELLFIARDRLGKKPLYYHLSSEGLLFGSEAKALLKHPKVNGALDPGALHHYLTFQYVPAPLSIFNSVKKLPAASYGIYDRRGFLEHRYWDLRFTPGKTLSEGEYCERIRALVTEATKLRLRSDVPLGAFLSGGLDSSIVVGVMSRELSRPVKTFSIGFREEEFSELPFAGAVARHFGTEHREYIVHPDLVKTLPEIAYYYDEPFADPSALPSYILARQTRQEVTVALNGDGGDEGFTGYDHYKDQLYMKYRLARAIPLRFRRIVYEHLLSAAGNRPADGYFGRKLRNFMSMAGRDPLEVNFDTITVFGDQEKRGLYSDEFCRWTELPSSFAVMRASTEASGSRDLIDRLQYADIMTYLPDDLLVKMDRASMANSLEVRSPLLDHVLMEFAASIPSRLRLKNNSNKYLLKKAFKGLLPDKIIARKKKGFGIPVDAWFRGPLKEYVREVLLDTSSLGRGYFKPAAVQALLEQHFSGAANNGNKLWSLMLLELWHRNYGARK